MQIDKRILGLCDIARKDGVISALAGVRFEKGKAVATDGYRLLIIEAEEPRLDDIPRVAGQEPVALENVTVRAKDLVRAVKPIKRNKHVEVLNTAWTVKAEEGFVRLVTTDLETTSIIDSRIIENSYPDYEKVIVKEEPKGVVRVDVKLLEGLLSAVRKAGVAHIDLEFHGELKPLQIKGKDFKEREVTALVMPIRRA
jgi:DNA polymerase III sliding clamp (beta) subunit (PCNA family)